MDDLRHLQLVLLDMIKEIDELCKKHGIKYFLCGGNAIGAERHQGFIPWDDDMDIMLYDNDYFRFLNMCRQELSSDKWAILEGEKDYPAQFSKVKLKNTYIEEIGEYKNLSPENRGIYIDVFRMSQVSDTSFGRLKQYICDKLIISYYLTITGYKTKSFIKNIMLKLSYLLHIRGIFNYCHNIVYKPRNISSHLIGRFGNNVRYNGCFMESRLFGTPKYKKYEDTFLPVPEQNEEYLKLVFGDYMKLPPESEQKPKHALKVDFGDY